MNDRQQYAPDYPYAPRPAPPVTPDTPLPPSPIGPTIWRWVKRSLAVTGLSAILLIIGISFFVYRAVRQAWSIAYLEQREAYVGCVEPSSAAQRQLCDTFGERLWGDIRTVTVTDGGFVTSFFSYTELDEKEMRSMCDVCSRFPKLHEFRVAHNAFSCQQIADWPQLDHLEELSVVSTQLTDADLAIIGRMTELKRLRIGSASITSAGISHLARLSKLESLSLDDVQFAVAAAQPAAGFQSLTEFMVHASPEIVDEAVVAFGSLPALEEVIFNRTSVGDRGLEHLVRGGRVRTLIMNESRVTNAGLASVEMCAKPFTLHVASAAITDDGLGALAGKQIDSLVLDKTAITDNGLRVIAQVNELSYLSLSDTKITGVGARHLNREETVPQLHLDGTLLESAGVVELSKLRCATLGLARTPIGDKELMLFVANDSLTELNVSETAVTESGVQAFYQARKKRRGMMEGSESLMLICDFPDVVTSIIGIDPSTGLPLSPAPTDGYAN